MTLYPHQIAIIDALDNAPKCTFVIEQSRQMGVTTMLLEYVKAQICRNTPKHILFVSANYDRAAHYIQELRRDRLIDDLSIDSTKSKITFPNGSSVQIGSAHALENCFCSNAYDIVIFENVEFYFDLKSFKSVHATLRHSLRTNSKVIYTCNSIPKYLKDDENIFYSRIPWYVLHDLKTAKRL